MEQNNPHAGNSTQSYLNTLPDAELNHILRQLSDRPRNANWHGEVAPSDVMNVLQLGGPLAVCAKQEFCRLSVWKRVSDKPALLVKWKSNEGIALFRDLLAELASTLHGLYINCSAASRKISVADSLNRCAQLRSLHVHDLFDSCYLRGILEACSGNLRELGITGGFLGADNANAIAEHCTGLEMFEMQYDRVDGDISAVWKTVGPTLVHMSFCIDLLDSSNGLGLIDKITLHCLKVSSVGYGSWNIDQAPLLVRLCEKLGSQVKFLKFHTPGLLPSEEQIGRILDSCPDLLVDAFVPHDQGDILCRFRDRVSSVHIKRKLNGNVEQVGSALCSLQKLRLNVFETEESMHFLTRFLSSPKTHLKYLCIEGLGLRFDLNSNALAGVASLVTSLEELSVTVRRIVPGVFRNIAKSNQRLKRDFVSCTSYRQHDEENGAVSFVEDFSQCPLLNELVLHSKALATGSTRIAEACAGLRRRRVDIFIGGRQYVC